MISKNLYFNLMKEDTKRHLWVPALISLVFFFSYPVWTAFMLSEYFSSDRISGWDDLAIGMADAKLRAVERFMEWTAAKNGFMVFLMIGFAVLCGVAVFSYLHSRQKTDFYHSLPIRRECLFAVSYLNGVLYTAVPYLINLLIAALILQVRVGYAISWGAIITGYLVHMVFYILLYSVVIVAVMLTGNTIVGLLGSAVFFLWGPLIGLMKYEYQATYFRTFYRGAGFPTELINYSSPASWYIYAVSKNGGMGLKVAVTALVAALITAGAVILYKMRPSEAAGRAMAFKKSQAAIKILLVVPIALFGSLLLYELKNSDGWSIFGLFCAMMISYCVIEIIYNFDFRKLFSHKSHLLICTVLSAAIVVFFRFDLAKYDSYIPSADKIESTGVYSYYLDHDALNGYHVEPELFYDDWQEKHYITWNSDSEEDLVSDMKLVNTADVLALAQQGIKDTLGDKTNAHYSGYRTSYEMNEDGENQKVIYGSVLIQYHLKNGKNVLRNYYLNMTKSETLIDSIYAQKEYKETTYPILTMAASDVAGINYQEYGQLSHVKFPDETMKSKLLASYQEELSNLDNQIRREQEPIAGIQFKTKEVQEMIDTLRKEDGRFYDFNNYYYYPIYPSFKKTISLLKECGIDAGNFLNRDNVEKIVFSQNIATRNEGGVEQAQFTVKDKEKIEEVLKMSVSSDTPFSTMNPVKYSIEVSAYVPIEKLPSKSINSEEFYGENAEISSEYYDESAESDPEYEIYHLFLMENKIPEFIKKEFNMDEETLN